MEGCRRRLRFLRRELTIILTYYSQEHNDIFQKCFDKCVDWHLLDIKDIYEGMKGEEDILFSSLGEQNIVNPIKELKGSYKRISNTKGQLVYTFNCEDDYAKEAFARYIESELEEFVHHRLYYYIFDDDELDDSISKIMLDITGNGKYDYDWEVKCNEN